jgi:putative endonuclease
LAFWVYIVANKRNGTIYVGHTDNIIGRIWLHRESALGAFSKKYGCTQLVWYEQHETRESAFRRERAIKEWRRSWKLLLIEKENPTWEDLYKRMYDQLTAAEPYDLGPLSSQTKCNTFYGGCWDGIQLRPAQARGAV